MNATRAETWLFDLGNSRAKVARLVAGAPAETQALDWGRPDFVAALRSLLDRWPKPERVRVASVVAAERAAAVREALAPYAANATDWLRTPRTAGGLTTYYAYPERLGIDRFLAMLAARARAPGACVVVGCGTALTLDAVAADGRHAEGLIALSPTGMLRALQGATAIADSNPDAFTAADADDTAVALHAGCWAAAGALVEWFLARATQRCGTQTLWLHGGRAQQLADWLARDGQPARVFEHAVLHGLAAWPAEPGVAGR